MPSSTPSPRCAPSPPLRTRHCFFCRGCSGQCSHCSLRCGAARPVGPLAICCALLLLMGALHRRFTIYSACAGAAMVPIAVTMISRHFDHRSPALAAAARLTLVLGLIVGPLAIQRAIAGAAGAEAPTGPCDLQAAAPMLAAFAGQVVTADVNDTPNSLSHRTADGRIAVLPRSKRLFSAPRGVAEQCRRPGPRRGAGDPCLARPVLPQRQAQLHGRGSAAGDAVGQAVAR